MIKYISNKKEVSDKISKAIFNSLDEVGEIIANEAAERAPVDTGALKRSIEYEVDGKEVSIGSDKDYASFIELGTAKQASQPFLKPAALDKVGIVGDIISNNINKEV